MALRNIVIDDDSILRKKCREVTVFDQRLHQLLDDMAETMYQADGVGLAAPQVGVLKRVVVIDVGEGLSRTDQPRNFGNFRYPDWFRRLPFPIQMSLGLSPALIK